MHFVNIFIQQKLNLKLEEINAVKITILRNPSKGFILTYSDILYLIFYDVIGIIGLAQYIVVEL